MSFATLPRYLKRSSTVSVGRNLVFVIPRGTSCYISPLGDTSMTLSGIPVPKLGVHVSTRHRDLILERPGESIHDAMISHDDVEKQCILPYITEQMEMSKLLIGADLSVISRLPAIVVEGVGSNALFRIITARPCRSAYIMDLSPTLSPLTPDRSVGVINVKIKHDASITTKIVELVACPVGCDIPVHIINYLMKGHKFDFIRLTHNGSQASSSSDELNSLVNIMDMFPSTLNRIIVNNAKLAYGAVHKSPMYPVRWYVPTFVDMQTHTTSRGHKNSPGTLPGHRSKKPSLLPLTVYTMRPPTPICCLPIATKSRLNKSVIGLPIDEAMGILGQKTTVGLMVMQNGSKLFANAVDETVLDIDCHMGIRELKFATGELDFKPPYKLQHHEVVAIDAGVCILRLKGS